MRISARLAMTLILTGTLALPVWAQRGAAPAGGTTGGPITNPASPTGISPAPMNPSSPPSTPSGTTPVSPSITTPNNGSVPAGTLPQGTTTGGTTPISPSIVTPGTTGTTTLPGQTPTTLPGQTPSSLPGTSNVFPAQPPGAIQTGPNATQQPSNTQGTQSGPNANQPNNNTRGVQTGPNATPSGTNPNHSGTGKSGAGGSGSVNSSTTNPTITTQQQLLTQLNQQSAGIQTLAGTLTQNRLGLTNGQVQQLQALNTTFNQQMQRIAQEANTNLEQAIRDFNALQTMLDVQLNGILTANQQQLLGGQTGTAMGFVSNSNQ